MKDDKSIDGLVIRRAKESRAAASDFLKPVEVFDFNKIEESEKKAKKNKKKDNKKNSGKIEETEEFSIKKTKKKEKKKVSKARKIITSILLSIVLLVIAAIVYLVVWGNDIIQKITGGSSSIWDAFTLLSEDYTPLQKDSNGRTNILIFGTSGYNMEGDEGRGVHDGAQLTDSIMVLSIDQNTGDIAMTSLPRDLKASPTCTATGKINEVYWCNNIRKDNEEGGARALMNEVTKILGIDFQYYVHVNWGSLIQIVNILDGINVTLDERVKDISNTIGTFEPGVTYTINGEQALAIARERKSTRGGDFSRGKNQQFVLIGIKNRLYEKELSIVDMVNLASTLGDNLRTNLSLEDFKTAAHLTYTFDFDTMRQIPLVDYNRNIYYFTTGNINGISYVLPNAGVNNYGAIQNYIRTQLSGTPVEREGARIMVLNGTGESGLAAKTRDELISQGYNVVKIDNAPESEYHYDLVFQLNANTPETAKTLAREKGIYVEESNYITEQIDCTDIDIVYIIGKIPEEDTETKTE